ncbi:hypothetical protein HNE_2913 [Hyphomonas neptunium ATCC 15444]|uniref:Lipoprotein n=2 Tax=Hyphomonas TaxID=85 RepID=Q0BY52_HYPNA|nr:hypothetical protein HNE_2913 [Hyphomonas neptunium ATCC 15444]
MVLEFAMIRACLAALAFAFALSQPAQAWVSGWSSFGEPNCTGKFSDKECLTKPARWVRSGDGAVHLRIKEFRGLPKSKVEAIFKSQGVDWSVFERDTYWRDGNDKENKDKARLARYTLRGLYTADGKTELMPPQFLAIYPFSDKVALVKIVDGNFRIATIGKNPVLSDIPFRWASFTTNFGGLQATPMTIQFEAPGSGDTRSHHLMAPDGTILTTIDNVLVPIKRDTTQPELRDPAYYGFDSGLIGFPIRTAAGTEASVFVDSRTGAIDRIDDPLTFLRVNNGMTEQYICGQSRGKPEWGGPKSYWAAMVKVGMLPESTGLPDRNIYMPLDDRGRPLAQTTGNLFVGMARISAEDSEIVAETRGWLFVYSEKGKLTYSVAGAATDDVVSSARYQMMPENVAQMAPRLQRVADVWFGRPDQDILETVIGEPVYHTYAMEMAVRLFSDPAKGAEGGMTNWTHVPVCEPVSLTSKFLDLTSLLASTETGANPLAVVSVAAGQKKARFLATLKYWAEADERAAAKEHAYLQTTINEANADMAAGKNVRGDHGFFHAARATGGRMLDYYWRDNQRLPLIEDASDICSRFGSNSAECRLVWPWAQGIYNQEEAARQAEAERYAAKQAADRADYQRAISKPAYVSSKPKEIQYCWRESGFWNC